MFKLFKKENKKKIDTVIVSNRLLDIRMGRKYARGDNMNGNTYECFKNTAQDVYTHSLTNSNDLQHVNKESFIEGYNAQTKELALIIK